jgi:hypothetical protein
MLIGGYRFLEPRFLAARLSGAGQLYSRRDFSVSFCSEYTSRRVETYGPERFRMNEPGRLVFTLL